MLKKEIIKQIISDNGQILRPRYYDRLEKDLYKLTQADPLAKYVNRDYPKGADIIECGCSWGMVAYANTVLKNLPIKSWTGYECDQRNISIANEIFRQLSPKVVPEFKHFAITNSTKKTVEIVEGPKRYADRSSVTTARKKLAHTALFAWKNKHTDIEAEHPCPNLHYSKLSKCDVLIMDIEGQERHVDFSKIDAHYFQVETHDKTFTKKLTQKISNSRKFKLLDVSLARKELRKRGQPDTGIPGQAVITFKNRARDDNDIGFRNRVTRN
tara:strand:- start:190 stop:999 length:810 start_codon:yes stop_codon:yes gene_type:complete